MSWNSQATDWPYRCGEQPMQVVSGPTYRRTVHSDAPPSSRMQAEMNAFVKWCGETRESHIGPLARAALVHLDFVSIHPFEDGNGRVARARLVRRQLLAHPRCASRNGAA